MLFYVTNAVIIFIGGKALKTRKQKAYVIPFLFCIYLQLILIFILRNSQVGFDSQTYITVFHQSPDAGNIFTHWMEWGYIGMNRLIRFFTDNVRILWFACGSIFISITLYFFSKHSQNVILSVFLFIMMGFYTHGMNQIREVIALSICLLAFHYFIKEKYMTSLFIVLLAMTFHKSAFVFIPYLLCWKLFKKNDVKTIILLLFLCISLFFSFKLVVNILGNIFYSHYLNESRLAYQLQIGNPKQLMTCLFLLALGLSYRKYYIHTFPLRAKEYEGLLRAVVFSTMIQFFSLKLSLVARLAAYFDIYICILIPNIIYSLRSASNKKIMKIIIILFIFIYAIFYFKFSENGFGKDGVCPYNFL